MKRRVIATVLSLLLLLSAVKVPAQATGSKEQQMKDHIVSTYFRALKRAGKYTFAKYCSTAVNSQLFCLGIEGTYRGCDAKDLFDRYRRGGVTSGGYPIRPYSGRNYTLRAALNEISLNGTRDAYNIMVGFQQARSSEQGYEFGHGIVIYAILDGMVYYIEGGPSYMHGHVIPEGVPIVCSIDDFCDHYESYTVLDGVVWFGNNTYVEVCVGRKVNMDAMSTNPTRLLTDIKDPEKEKEPEVAINVPAGSIVQISRIFETPEGEYWYEAQWEGSYGYIETDAVKLLPTEEEQIQAGADNVHMPSYLRKGRWFHLGGQIHAGNGTFGKVRIQIHSSEIDKGVEPVFSAEMQVDSNTVVLSKVAENGIRWNELPVGDFRMTIFAQVNFERWTGSGFETVADTQELWVSEFHVVDDNTTTLPEVTFNGNGGNSRLERTFTQKGEPLGKLPKARRKGYTFLGWFTEPTGGQEITEDTTVDGKVTYYAHWAAGEKKYTGWLKVEEQWVYYRNGSPVKGWFYYNGRRFWQEADGSKPEQWKMIDKQWYYFTSTGAVYTGWLETPYGLCYLKSDGTKAIGWITIQGRECCFDIYGKLIKKL